MRRGSIAWGGLLAAMALASCEHAVRPVSLTHGTRTYAARDYRDVFDQWTRAERVLVLQGLDERINVSATYFSWDFRWAYVARWAHDATLSETERQQVLATSLGQLEQEHEFYVALSTLTWRWGDLAHDRSAWRVRLIDDRGREVAPVRIEAVRRITAIDREYFPYTNPWRQVFKIHFPHQGIANGAPYEVLGPGTRYFILRFAGALGTADLRWDVREHG